MSHDSFKALAVPGGRPAPPPVPVECKFAGHGHRCYMLTRLTQHDHTLIPWRPRCPQALDLSRTMSYLLTPTFQCKHQQVKRHLDQWQLRAFL
jgi:hypothetical protein